MIRQGDEKYMKRNRFRAGSTKVSVNENFEILVLAVTVSEQITAICLYFCPIV
jgi:hypothetical protein